MRRNPAQLAFVLTAVLSVAAVGWAASVLPERVPTHFGAAGAADDWSSRAGAVTGLGVLSVGMIAMFAGLVRWTPRLPIEWINVPEKQRWIGAGLEGELRRRLRVDLLLFGAGVNVVSLAVTLGMVHAARSADGGLPWWWFAVMAAWLVSTVVHVVVLHAVRYRLGPVDR